MNMDDLAMFIQAQGQSHVEPTPKEVVAPAQEPPRNPPKVLARPHQQTHAAIIEDIEEENNETLERLRRLRGQSDAMIGQQLDSSPKKANVSAEKHSKTKSNVKNPHNDPMSSGKKEEPRYEKLYYQSLTKPHTLELEFRQEQKIAEECTFTPALDESSRQLCEKNNLEPITTRYTHELEKREAKIKKLKKEKKEKEAQEYVRYVEIQKAIERRLLQQGGRSRSGARGEHGQHTHTSSQRALYAKYNSKVDIPPIAMIEPDTFYNENLQWIEAREDKLHKIRENLTLKEDNLNRNPETNSDYNQR
jgi:hypothetical protein